MKKYFPILLLIILVVPSVAFASWWNPLSWFNKWTFHKQTSSFVIQEPLPETEHSLSTNNPQETRVERTKSLPVKQEVELTKQNNSYFTVQESRTCAQQAKIMDDNFKTNILQSGGSNLLRNTISSFTNHYNSKQGKCYMLSSSTTYFPSGPIVGEELYDVYDNKSIATYSAPLNMTPGSFTLCLINGVSNNCTKETFDIFVNSAMKN